MQNYALEGAIGQGQFGVAYKARHKLDGQLYCIKRIPMAAKDDQKATLSEAQLLSSLDHPNIISYKECLIDEEGSLCIVTSFCEEGDLFKRIRDKDAKKEFFSENEVMDMFIQIASALLYIHSKKILHRDLKTQNIFIARGGIMVLGDFGISKVLEKTDQFATTVTGTPYYMAPEICSSQPYTFKSDIWSLGCVLYELCTLKHAFAADSLLSLVYQIVRGNFPPIPKEMFSPGLSNLVNALLVREPNQRPSLQQVFQIPYVQQHVQRYHHEEKRRVKRTITKREHMMEERAEMASTTKADPDWDKLTPQQQRAKRRELQTQRRELELKLATMNVSQSQNRRQIEERKQRMVHQSNVGLSSNKAAAASQDPWDIDTLSDSTRKRGESAMDNSLVNMGTMSGTIPSSSTYVDPQARTKPSSRPGSAYESYENRTVGGRTQAPGGDTVLMGSVMSGAGRTGAGWGTAESMVNMGTVNFAESTRGGSTVNYGSTSGGMPYNAPTVHTLDTFKFGGANGAGMPQLGFKRTPNLSNSQSLPQSPATPHLTKPRETKFSSTGHTPQKDDYESEYTSEYESDFEDYDDEEGAQMVNQRMKILSNVEDLERSVFGARSLSQQESSLVMVQDKVNSAVKTNKAQALRDRCMDILGYHFGDVYSYLRRARSSEQPQDEAVVQRRLLELVGGNKGLMQGCFMVDQLVFQESMWSQR